MARSCCSFRHQKQLQSRQKQSCPTLKAGLSPPETEVQGPSALCTSTFSKFVLTQMHTECLEDFIQFASLAQDAVCSPLALIVLQQKHMGCFTF